MKEIGGNAYKRVLFQGYSMYPFLRPGDVLVLAAVKVRSVERGDIICVTDGRRYITHRVVDIRYQPRAATLITKGDNLPRPDRPLSLNSGSLLKVAMIVRENGRLIRPRFGRALALLSRSNLLPGIIQGRIGRIIRGVYGRFHTLVNKEPTRQ
jgi:hypothetical protein